ncbi:MAG TPA: NUDIX domain-containing protein, partial [Gemmatimonadaceae bacterium]|nr:NUDIX domain-containing protein [Gemmatimonadaceae bacterium]
MRDRSARTSCFSIDAVLVTATRNELAVLLARNSSERERWSLPWRSPQGGETFEIAASRSAQEALGEAPNWMEQIGAFADGKRHPSEADVSVAYLGLVPHETASPRAGYTWFQVADLPAISPRQRAMVEGAV